jgi:ABC-type antimicrobial peptide transport system permease subunit
LISWSDRFAESIAALRDNRLRTALSVLGIAIGIAAVMIVSTISRGGNHLVFSELETFGLNSVWAYRDWANDSPLERQRNGSGIDSRDVQVISEQREALGIRSLSPIVRHYRNTPARRRAEFANIQLIGANVDYLDIVNDRLIGGRSMMQHDEEQRLAVALVAPEAVTKLFDADENPIGKVIDIDGRRITIIGLLAGKSRDFLSSIGSAGGESANDRVIVPWTYLQRVRGDNEVDHLHMAVQNFDEAASVADEVVGILSRRHAGHFNYTSETMASYIATTDTILGGVAIVGTIAASISLLVGGMGIMNMMGTAVLERTREIGLRMAVGARQQDILLQFLIEAAVISLVGGVIGLLVGAGISVVVVWLTGFPLLPSVVGIVGAMCVSVVVGLLSGLLPARRASRLKPVEALRTD